MIGHHDPRDVQALALRRDVDRRISANAARAAAGNWFRAWQWKSERAASAGAAWMRSGTRATASPASTRGVSRNQGSGRRIRAGLLAMSAATIDRSLQGSGRRPATGVASGVGGVPVSCWFLNVVASG